jgi:hypothetical protein
MSAPIAVNVTTQPQLLWSGRNGAGSLLLMNNDIVNTVNVGTAENALIVPIGPLGALSVDPTENWYVIGTAVGTAPLIVAPGGTTWTPSPAQVAASISALGLATSAQQTTQTAVISSTPDSTAALIATGNTNGAPGGVPLLRFTNQLGMANGATIAGAATATLFTGVPINQTSYEGSFTLNLPAGAGTGPFATLTFNWFDAATNDIIDSEVQILTSGNGPTHALTYYVSGPTRGNQISVTLTNADPTQVLTYSYIMNQTSHVYTRDRCLQNAYATTAPITFQNPNGVPTPGILFEVAAAVGNVGTITRLLCVWNGKMWITIDNGAQAEGVFVKLTDASGLLSGSTTSEPFAMVVAAGLRAMQEFVMPNGPMLLSITNQGATSITPVITGTKEEY